MKLRTHENATNDVYVRLTFKIPGKKARSLSIQGAPFEKVVKYLTDELSKKRTMEVSMLTKQPRTYMDIGMMGRPNSVKIKTLTVYNIGLDELYSEMYDLVNNWDERKPPKQKLPELIPVEGYNGLMEMEYDPEKDYFVQSETTKPRPINGADESDWTYTYRVTEFESMDSRKLIYSGVVTIPAKEVEKLKYDLQKYFDDTLRTFFEVESVISF